MLQNFQNVAFAQDLYIVIPCSCLYSFARVKAETIAKTTYRMAYSVQCTKQIAKALSSGLGLRATIRRDTFIFFPLPIMLNRSSPSLS